MKLMMFEKGKGAALGLVDGKTVIDLGAADPALPKDLKSLIAAGPSALAAVKAAAAKAPASAKLALDAVKPALPIDPPAKIVCVGLNYALHAKEGGHPIPTYPSFFLRVPTSLVAAGAPVIRPKGSTQLDYECELTIVIGKRGPAHPGGQGARATCSAIRSSTTCRCATSSARPRSGRRARTSTPRARWAPGSSRRTSCRPVLPACGS